MIGAPAVDRPCDPDARTVDVDGKPPVVAPSTMSVTCIGRSWRNRPTLITIVQHHRGLARVTEHLFELFNRHQHARRLGRSATRPTLRPRCWLRLPRRNTRWRCWEIAIGSGQTAGRTRFAHELARRVSQARRASIDVVTLVPRVAPVQEHVDLVVKHGILRGRGRGRAAEARRGRRSADAALRSLAILGFRKSAVAIVVAARGRLDAAPQNSPCRPRGRNVSLGHRCGGH